MGGGLMQLVAYGAQDIYLTGNPQITFFKVVYRRHTNFSMETIKQSIDGTSDINETTTTRGTVTINRNGDLVHKIYVTAKDSKGISNGSALVQEVILEIGGQEIDKHTQEWNEIWSELTVPGAKIDGFKDMVGDLHKTTNLAQVPLNFWFCRNPGLALPLIALQYHEVKLFFTFGSGRQIGAFSNQVNNGETGLTPTPTVNVYCDYIYLDTDERRRFAQVSHEYLIEQLQIRNCKASKTQDLNFNHPVKELIWTCYDNYDTAKIVLNGQDRFEPQDEKYFQLRQPYDHHTSIPGFNITNDDDVSNTLIGHSGTTQLFGIKLIPLATHGGYTGTSNTSSLASENILKLVHDGTTNSDHPFGSVDIQNNDEVDGNIGKSCFISFHNNESADVNIKNIYQQLINLRIDDILKFTHPDAVNGFTFELKITRSTRKTSTRDKQYYFESVLSSFVLNGDNTLSLLNTTVNGNPGDSNLIPFDTTGGYNLEIKKSHNLQKHYNHTTNIKAKINVYSFALKPEEHQPSGSCNFSRIDTAQLITGYPLNSDEKIYAVNYNVLRIMSGMGGLAYSN